MRISESNVRLKVLESANLALKVGSERIPIYPDSYNGEYNIDPSQHEQVLKTSGLMMLDDVRVGKIPDCYGLITWNGSFLKIS